MNNTDLLLTKIDNFIQKSKETRNRVVNQSRSRQRGGNFDNLGDIDEFVDLSTPVNHQMGGKRNRNKTSNKRVQKRVQKGGNFDIKIGNDEFVDLDTPINPENRSQKGGNIKIDKINYNNGFDEFVDLDTPIDPQNKMQKGGNNTDNDGIKTVDLTEAEEIDSVSKEKFTSVDKISDITKIDFGLEKADKALASFDMIGGCGCGGYDDVLFNTNNSCGSSSYDETPKNQNGGSANIVDDLARAFKSVDGLLHGF